jgi:hypothetical protein
MVIAKRGQDHIKERGNNLLNNFKEQYSNQEEATARACNASCTTNYNALCGDVKDACSTGGDDRASLSRTIVYLQRGKECRLQQ